MKLICLHGFLGTPSDFDFLKEKYQVYAPELDSLVEFNSSQVANHLSSEIKENTALVGYSFGARLAMQIFLERADDFSKLILFAGHMGIKDDSERIERRKFEKLNIDKLCSEPIDTYIENWNKLELFNGDVDITHTSQEASKCSLYFSRWGLSVQPYMLDALLKYRDKIYIYYGENDHKYCNYANDQLQSFNVKFLSGVGHRIIQHKEIVLTELDRIIC